MTALPPLQGDDFRAVFAAIHGHAPHAWQERLMAEVRAGRWPGIISAPTAAGKTAVLDVALFHLALEADRQPRRAPMRIVLAVDRRIIVDQAFDRARRIQKALEQAAPDTALNRMATRLAALSGDRPLHVAELRGGMPLEQDWARRADQPTILCTTVDQLGSRLLFRGYGVSSAMAPIHAGLLGCDALLILDEAHLSRAFAGTLDAIACARGGEQALGLPWGWTALTATPHRTDGTVFVLTEDERQAPTLARRLTAHKPVALRDKAAGAEAFAQAARELRDMLQQRGEAAPVIAVVVNRVLLARQVFELLRRNEEADAILLTGRVRPVERDALIETWRDRLEGRVRDASRPLFVVATQCIEAGADFDFDAMVSQIAPLDALRQRFGRLARSGNRGGAPAPGMILAEPDKIDTPDPIYGSAPAETWAWLRQVGNTDSRGKSVDFGPVALDALLATHPAGDACMAPAPAAPPLRDADLAAFAMTAPRPFPDPEVALLLHGELRDEAEVSLVWRGDLDGLLDQLDDDRDRVLARLTEVLALVPPRPAEALRLPLRTARRWLTTDEAPQEDWLADVPADVAEEEGAFRRTAEHVLCWRGGKDVACLAPAELRAGDVVVLSCARGGCDAFGWAPTSPAPVSDIADAAARPYAGRMAALRLHPKVWPAEAAPWSTIAALLEAGASEMELARASGLRDWADATRLTLAQPYGEDPSAGAILVAAKGLASAADAGAIPATEADEGLFAPEPVLLDDHARAVAALARRHAVALGLPDDLVETLATAGAWHDAGKADPRFQLWLRSIEGLPEDGPPIAKTTARASPARQDALRAAAALPRLWRHEVASVRIALQRLVQGETVPDPDLLLWLIGTHHGHGRPFFPHGDDWDEHGIDLAGLSLSPRPGPDKLDFDWDGADWAGLMERLRARYGLWDLAFLEACLRLADHRASAGEVS